MCTEHVESSLAFSKKMSYGCYTHLLRLVECYHLNSFLYYRERDSNINLLEGYKWPKSFGVDSCQHIGALQTKIFLKKKKKKKKLSNILVCHSLEKML